MPSSSPTASVVNRGTISVAEGGVVALVAPGVANDGVIQARLGRVSLVSADRFTVDFHGDQLIRFALDDTVARTVVAPDGMALTAAVSNAGRIVANGGTVQMSANVASGVLDHVIDMSGVVEARSVRKVNGTVVLDGGAAGTVAVSGRIDASGRGAGQTGGTVQILGQHVGLFSGADVNASGGAGGGTVLVGGNQHGQGPQPNAQATYVDANATITADATVKGNGGTVVVWSDQYTNFAGTISARGGPQGGNGGNVETSAHGVLSVTGRVDTSAPNGKGGQWLLDPFDVTITTTNPNPPGTFNGTLAGGIFTATGNSATIDPGVISNALSTGTNVTIDTNAGAGGQNGTITFAADGTITMSGGGTATLTLIAGTNAAGTLATGSGGMMVTGTPSITTTGGSQLNVVISIGNAGNSTGGSGAGAYLPGMSLGAGSLTVNSSGGHVYATNAISAGGAVTINLDTNGTSGGAGHGIDLNNAANNITGALSLLNAGGSGVTIFNNGALNLGTSTFIGGAGGPVSITAAGSITQSGTLTNTSGASLTVGVSTPGSDILLNTQANDLGTGISLGGTLADIRDFGLRNTDVAATLPGLGGLTNLRNLTLQSNNAAVVLGGFSASGSVSITAGGAITQTASASVAGTSSFSAGAHAIALTQAANHFTGAVSLTNSGANAASLTNSVATVLGGSSVGSLAVISSGTISQTGALTVTGATSLASTAANTDIQLNTQANNFGGLVSIGGVTANVRDFGLRNVAAGATLPSLTGLTNLRNLTLQFDNAPITLGGFTATGNAAITAGGAITQTAAISVAGTASFSAGANTITLTQAGNSFGGFTVTSGQTVATGTIAGVSGGGAALLATDPGSSGTQTFNGCTIAVGCATTAPSGPSPTTTVTATNTAQQVVGVLGQSGSDNGDSGNSNVRGFEVQIPLTNIDWSDPAGDLRVSLAPEYKPLGRFFYGGEEAKALLNGRGGR
jgi:hypothetical protein